jgi:hypothetical protein
MTIASDTYVIGSVVAASLAPQAVDGFDPTLKCMLRGQQLFVKLADGRWRPQGCSLGLARCFTFDDLLTPVARP